MNKINETSRQLEPEVLLLLEANQGKKYRCHELSKRFEVTKDMMARTMERLAGRNLVAVDHPHGGKHYSHKQAETIEPGRVYVLKPYIMPQVLKDIQDLCDRQRKEYQSKFD